MRTPSILCFAVATTVAPLTAQTVQAPFNALYTITNIGTIPGLGTTIL